MVCRGRTARSNPLEGSRDWCCGGASANETDGLQGGNKRDGAGRTQKPSKLKRSELLEIILAQSEEIERLRAELAQKDAELESRRIAIAESGSIAEASLKLTRIFEEAQKAADLYVANVQRGQSGHGRPDSGQAPRERV